MGTVYYRHSMVRHHTKDKGDLGVAKAHADLAAKGFTVLFPATEHAPFDLVAYAEGQISPAPGQVPFGAGGCRYYIRPTGHNYSATLRVAPSRNGQTSGVLTAASCRQFPA